MTGITTAVWKRIDDVIFSNRDIQWSWEGPSVLRHDATPLWLLDNPEGNTVEKTHRGNIEGQGLSHASSCNVWRPAAQKGIGEREFEVPSNTQAIRSSVRQYLARGNRAPFWHVWYVASVVGGLPQKYTHERKFFFFFLLSGCFGSQIPSRPWRQISPGLYVTLCVWVCVVTVFPAKSQEDKRAKNMSVGGWTGSDHQDPCLTGILG